MSMLHSLQRFVDPEFHQQQAEKRRKREAIPPETDPNEVELVLPDRIRPDPKELTCRVCGLAGSDKYCPVCLAETMEQSND